MKTSPSFVVEIPLHTSSKEEMVLQKRFWAAKQQYNALLGETLKRLDKVRKDSSFALAQQLYKEKGKIGETKALFKNLYQKHGLREYDLYAFCKQWNQATSPLRIGARLSQKLAKRVFDSVQKYIQKKRGKPRFKGFRGLSSIEDNSIDANLRMKENQLHYLGISMPLLWDIKDPIHAHGQLSKHKYARLVRRKFGQKNRYFAQIVCEGQPFIKSKNLASDNTIGLDIGPSTIAIVSPQSNQASLSLFCDELKKNKKIQLKLQRRISRKLRANNPNAFHSDKFEKKDKHWTRKLGKSKKGIKLKTKSKKLLAITNQLGDLKRREASFRKSQHGKMINEILQLGKHIKTEKLSYKSFQKNFGKSVGLRAPGMFLEMLRRKAENAGGKVEEFNTYRTALSQSCHCGIKKKKKLSTRWHRCDCGVEAQRDLYSAYLANFVENDTLIVEQAQKAWSRMDIALRTAMSELKQASSRSIPASLGLSGAELVVCAVS